MHASRGRWSKVRYTGFLQVFSPPPIQRLVLPRFARTSSHSMQVLVPEHPFRQLVPLTRVPWPQANQTKDGAPCVMKAHRSAHLSHRFLRKSLNKFGFGVPAKIGELTCAQRVADRGLTGWLKTC